MNARFQTWRLLLLILAGWIIRQQQNAIDYFLTEIRIRREKLGKNRILLSDDQRRRLAVKGEILGRKMLEQLSGIVNSLPGTGTTAGGGKTLDGHRCRRKLLSWFCGLPAKVRHGAVAGYRERRRIWDTAFRTRWSPTSSRPTASSRRRIGGGGMGVVYKAIYARNSPMTEGSSCHGKATMSRDGRNRRGVRQMTRP
jgi:hypothetical protein